MADSAGISVYDLMPAKPADAPKPKAKGISVHDLAKPVAPKPSGFSRLVDEAGQITLPKGEEIQPALNRGLAWIDEKLGETEYGRSVKAAFSSAADLQASGRAHVAHAQGPMAPVEGMGGVAEMSLGALATLFAPLTALTEQAAVRPTQAVTKKVAGEIEKRVPEGSRAGFEKGEQRVEGLEDFALQTASQFAIGGGASKPRVPGRPVTMTGAERQAFLARKVDLRTKFDSLAATDPFAAGAIADHIEQVDPLTARYMKRRIQKFVDASDAELSIIGKNAADAAIRELEGDIEKFRPQASGTNTGEGLASPGRGRKSGPAGPMIPSEDRTGLSTGEGMKSPKKGGPSGPAAPLIPEPKALTGEQVASTIRTAAKEGLEALTKEPVKEPVKVDMSKPKELRAIEREGEAARRDREDPNEPPSPNDPEIIYFNMGVPVTRAHVDAAFKWAQEKIPGVEIAKGKMAALYNAYIETFNPEAKGAAARTAGSAVAQNFFEQAHREHVVWEQGKQRRVYWQKMGDKPSMEFINGFERGKRFSNPQWESARQLYNSWSADIFKQDMKTGFTYNPVDHYMPHLFQDSEGIQRWMQKRYGNRWADPRFIKERGFDLYSEAIEAGFTPKFKSPEDIMQARQHASDIAALRTDLLADLERKGAAVKAEKGAEKPPPGYSANSRRSPTGVRYWVREDAEPLMHNAFDSASLWNLQGSAVKRGVSQGFRGWMAMKNALIPIKLGLSLFHPMHVLHIDASATLARETKSMVGNPSAANARDFMLNAATAYLQPLWTNPRIGYPILQVFRGKRDFATLSDADKAAFRDLAEGGMVPTRPKEETSGSIQKWKDAVNKRAAGAVYHAPLAALAAISHPLFGVWIPTLKIASYLKDVRAARELNPDWTSQQRQEAFRQVSRKVEARYGEMNYNSLFMDKMLKDIGVATNLSLGWNIGLLDQYVGGAIDLTRAAAGRAEMKSGMWDRPVFAAYYVGTALAIGGLMHYFFTGKPPEKLIDYTHPQSGEVDEYGKPVRLNTMFYTREFEGLYKHMQQEGMVSGLTDFVANKGSGLMEMSKTALKGVDSLGNNIRDPDAPAYKQFEQTLANTLSGLNSISLEAIEKSTGSPVKKVGLSVLGFTPAGKYISETVTEGRIASDYNKYVRPKEKPFQAVEMAKDVKELRKLFNANDPKYDDKLEGAAKKYDMTDKDVHRMEKLFASPKEQEFDPSVYMFQHLPWESQKPLLDKMSPEERETYLPHISKAKRTKYERETE